jgi:hypothetical protein
MAGRPKLLAQLLALCVASTALGAGTSGVSNSGASTGTMGASRSASGTSSSASGRSTTTTRFGGSGMYGSHYGPAPALDPKRKISEQDCTKPIVFDGGNLRCK